MATISPEQAILKKLDEYIDMACKDLGDESAEDVCPLASKKLQLRRFCASLQKIPELFDSHWGKKKRMILFEVLSDKNCWVKVRGLRGTQYEELNSRLAAQKLVAYEDPSNCYGLTDFSRYQIACWFCLTDDIKKLFDKFVAARTEEPKKVAKSLVGRVGESDYMLEYWSYWHAGCFYKLQLEGRKNKWVVGLDYALAMPHQQLDAVKFFWGKLKEKKLDEGEVERVLVKAVSRVMQRNGAQAFARAPHVLNYLFDELGDMSTEYFIAEDIVCSYMAFEVLEKLALDCYFGNARIAARWSNFRVEKLRRLIESLSRRKCHREEASQLANSLRKNLEKLSK